MSLKWVGGLSKIDTRVSQPPTITTATAATATKNMIWLAARGPVGSGRRSPGACPGPSRRRRRVARFASSEPSNFSSSVMSVVLGAVPRVARPRSTSPATWIDPPVFSAAPSRIPTIPSANGFRAGSGRAMHKGVSRGDRPAAGRRLTHFTTRYLRCATPGASIARTCSSSRSEPTSSNSRSPPPSRIGTTWSSSSSTRPAARYWWMALAPPPSETSLLAGRLPACSSADSIPSVTKLKVVSRDRQRLALVVGEDEDRRVEGRVLAPPALPGIVAPRPAAGRRTCCGP